MKQLKTTVFVSFCQVEKDIKMKVNNNEQRGINKNVIEIGRAHV